MSLDLAVATPARRFPRALVQRRLTSGDGHRIKRRRYYLYTRSPEAGWSRSAAVPCVELEGGRLYVGGVQILYPRITADQISWLQHSRDEQGTHYTAGQLFLHSNGLAAHGTVLLGTSPADAVRHDVQATATPTIHYTTQLTSARYATDTSPSQLPASAWAEGLALDISYEQRVGSTVPTPVVKLGGEDLTDFCSWSVTDDETILSIALSSSVCQIVPQFYARARLAFDALMLDPPGTGTVDQLCSELVADPKTTRFWKTSAPVVMATRSRVPFRRSVSPTQLLAVASAPLSINELMTLLPDDVVSDSANSMLMRNMKWAMGQDKTEKQWLAQFFNEAPPAIVDTDQLALAKQSLSWYQSRFAKAYLTQSFNSYSGVGEPTHRLNSREESKLDTYLRSGLASEKDFNVQQQGIYIQAYIATKDRLRSYLNDPEKELVGWARGTVVFTRSDASADLVVPAGLTIKTASGVEFQTQDAVTIKKGKSASDKVTVLAVVAGASGIVQAGTITALTTQAPAGLTGVTNAAATTLSPDSGGLKWAKKLFTALTTGTQFVLMVNRVAGAAGDPKALGPVNNFACLLTALDPTGKLASSYFQSIMSGVIVKLVPDVVHRDEDTIMQWLPTTMQELLRKLANGELPDETDISAQEALEMYQEYLKHAAEISAATAELLQSIVASGLLSQMRSAEDAFQRTVAERWPKLAKASRFMLAIGWIGAVTSVIVSLCKGDWKKMTDIEKAEFVTNCVQLAVLGFEAVPIIFAGCKSVTLTTWNKLADWWNAPGAQQSLNAEANTLSEGNAAAREAEVMDGVIQKAEGGATLGKGTIFERIFADGLVSGVVKIVGAVAAAAMAAYSLWQLIDDVQNHGSVSTLVFDSLTFATNLLSAVCLVVDLFVGTSFLPIAGALLAIAGILIGFLAGFFEKPASPLEQWMQDYGIPFADSLPDPAPALAVA